MQEQSLLNYRKELLHFRIARWQELPNFDLYSDQVLKIVGSQLSFVHLPDGEFIITSTMINNYVKLGFLERPHKKKYERAHIAKLIVISLLKQILPLGDIQKGMALQIALHGEEEAYNIFCEELENAFKLIASVGIKENSSLLISDIRQDCLALKMVTLSVVSKLLTQKIISLDGLQAFDRQGENNNEK